MGRAGVVMLITVGLGGLTGCRQIFGEDDPPSVDASIDAYIPDAGPCGTLSLKCAGPDTLRACTTLGQMPTDTTCAWGCNSTGTAHCGSLAPSGGGVTAMDVTTTTGLASTLLSAVTTIDDTGAISGLRAAGTGVSPSGIGFQIQNNIAIYTFQDLTIANLILLRGTHPIALVSTATMSISGAGIDVTGGCGNNQMTGGPGGFNGGDNDKDGAGAGGGHGGVLTGGGAGGGFGALGGAGGKDAANNMAAAGIVNGTADLATLIGGGGGGGGAGASAGNGGGGGGALQLVANTTLIIGAKINAGGCGAHHGAAGGYGGGGGGAGGAILVEAHDITLMAGAFFAVNGGGGGGFSGGSNGEDGQSSAVAAMGGNNGGGNGGASGSIGGDNGGNGAGGGGGCGRIRFNTKAGSVATLVDSMASPTRNENPTTTTIGSAATE